MKFTQIHKLTTITRDDISAGYQIAQSCHSVADFAYHNPSEFKEWRKNSNYKICLTIKDEKSLEKLYLKLKDRGVNVIPFREPDLNNQLTAITFVNSPEFNKYTRYLPLAGKNRESSSVVRTPDSKSVKREFDPHLSH